MLPSGVRLRAALLALLGFFASGKLAHAEDPRELFGLGKTEPAAEAEDPCADPLGFGCAMVTDPLEADASPYGLTTWLSAAYLRRLPVANVTHDAIAHYGLGASRDETGPFFGGATGLENRWTIDGAPSDSMITGAAETRIPLTFIDGLLISAGGFAARDRASTGGTIDVRLRRGGDTHALETAVWAGLSAETRRRPPAPLSYSVRRLTIDAGPELTASVVATGPLGARLGGTAWYAAGVQPTLGFTDAGWHAARLVDLDGDQVIDISNGQPVLQPISTTSDRAPDVLIPFMARVGLDRGPHAVDLTLIGQAGRGRRWLVNSTARAAGIDRTELVGDGIATWKGSWDDTRAIVQLAWHRADRDDTPSDDAANVPQLLSAYVPTSLPDDPVLAQLCNDMTYPGIPQCPVPFGYFASAGAGQLVHTIGDRPTATAELAHRLGAHVLRVGGTLEDARLITRSSFTGGEQLRSLFDGHLDRLRYWKGDCGDDPGTPCDYVGVSELRYRTRYTAAYVEDTFSPSEGIRADAGMRWELMWVGERLHFSNQLSPRLGLAWDVLGGGRSRVWTSMGRSYPLLPTGLGPSVIRRDATVHDATSSFGESRDVDVGAVYGVSPLIEPMAQDELTAGIEIGLAKTFRLIAWVQGRWLRRGLETTPDGVDNPGRIYGQPARRDSEQLAVEVATSPTAKLTVRAGYLAGRTIGNFLGPYDPRQGVILYDGSDWNQDASSGNLIGRLPTDVGHRVFVEANRTITPSSSSSSTPAAVQFAVAARLTVSSGRPRSAFADTDIGLISLLPRGAIGRGPMLAQANVRLAATWRGFEVTLDVFNAFDRGAATRVDELYAQDLIRPIEGGGYEDLVFLKTIDGANPRRRSAYGLPLAFQGPLSATIGVHRAF